MRRANTTFVNLRATLDDLDAAGRRVQAGGQEAAPLPRRAAPAGPRRAADGARPVGPRPPPGADNDLIELHAGHRPAPRHRRRARSSATARSARARCPRSAKALKEATPELATARPYAPDLIGWFDDFSHTGFYDALGGGEPRRALRQRLRARQRRAQAAAGPVEQSAAFKDATSLNQRSRCPGSIERGATVEADPPTSPATRPRGRSAHEARARSPSSSSPASASPCSCATGAGSTPARQATGSSSTTPSA